MFYIKSVIAMSFTFIKHLSPPLPLFQQDTIIQMIQKVSSIIYFFVFKPLDLPSFFLPAYDVLMKDILTLLTK